MKLNRVSISNMFFNPFTKLKNVKYTALAALTLASSTCISSCSYFDNEQNKNEIENEAPKLNPKQEKIRIAEAEFELRKEKIRENYEINKRAKMLDSIPILQDTDKKSLAKILKDLEIDNIKLIKEKNGITEALIHTPNSTYNMILGKTNDNSIAGIAIKKTEDEQKELYLLKIGFIDTNKSYQMKISHIGTLQDCVSKIIIDNKNVSLGKFIRNTSTIKGINTIDKIINKLNEECETTVYTLDKNTNKTTKLLLN